MDGVQSPNPQPQGSQNQKPQKNNRPNFAAGASVGRGKRPSWSSKVLVGILVVVGIIIVLVLAINTFTGGSSDIDEDRYQALFLTNGQVYFGKLSNVNKPYVELRDIYYLQVAQPQEEGEEQLQPASQNQQISLAKLGNELHGPDNEMFVSRSQVLFWENLKEEGQVTQAILDHKSQQGGNGDGNDADQGTEATGEEQ